MTWRRRTPATLAPLAQIMFSAAAIGAVRPMLSYRAIEAGGGAVEVGVIATSYALLPVVLAFAFGRRIDRHGPYRYVIGGNILFVAGIAVALVATNLPVLYVSSAMLGLGQMVAVLAQQAAAARTGPGERDRSFGRLTAAAALGQAVGPAAAALAVAHAGGVFGLSDTTIALAAGLALCLLGLPAALAMRTAVAPEHSHPAATGSSRSIAWKIVRIDGMWQALLSGAIVLSAVDLLSAFLPLWASDRGVSVATVSVLLTIRGAFTLLVRVFADRMVLAVGRRALLVGSLVAAAVGLTLLPFTGVAAAAVIMAVLGAGLGLAQPLTMSWVSIVTAPGTGAAALGIRQTANRVAQATLPAVVAGAVAGSGADGVFWGAAVLLVGASAALLRAPMGTG